MATILAEPTTSNEAFLEQFAAPGRVGLAGGRALVDRAIRRAQRRLSPGNEPSRWSHAFLCLGRRIDGKHWILESDLDFHRKQIRLGLQENRLTKYHDSERCPNLAILDFQLDDEGVRKVLTAGLDLLAGLSRYSVRELVGTLLAIRRPSLRARDNLLARDGAIFCSALVQHCYAAVEIEFSSGVALKHTTPEDIAATRVPHTAHLLIRDEPRSR